MPPLARASVPDLLFAELRDAILGGHYASGERLPPQRALALEYDVNLASVRAAIARLAQLRLVETRHGDGSRVLDWRASGGLEALALLGSVGDSVIEPLFEARRLLLREAGRLAASRRSRGQAERLSSLADAIAAAADDGAALLADWTFMSAVVEASGNLIFQLIMNSVRELYLPKLERFGAIVAGREQLAPLYRKAAKAIADGDSDRAAEAIERLTGAQERRMVGSGRAGK